MSFLKKKAAKNAPPKGGSSGKQRKPPKGGDTPQDLLGNQALLEEVVEQPSETSLLDLDGPRVMPPLPEVPRQMPPLPDVPNQRQMPPLPDVPSPRRPTRPPPPIPTQNRQQPTPEPILGDKDVKKQKRLGGKSLNAVDKIEYKKKLGESKTGFFKAEAGNKIGDAARNVGIQGNMATRAVLSSRLDKALGTNVLSEERFAEHGGEKGSTSGLSKGKALTERLYEDNATPVEQYLTRQEVQAPNMQQHYQIAKNGEIFRKSGLRFNYTDVQNPEFQKGMANLQFNDYLTGQVDRHLANIFADPKTGKVTGIDNDQAFGKDNDRWRDNSGFGAGQQVTQLPELVDEATAEAFLAMSEQDFLDILKGQDDDFGQLDDDERAAALERYRDMRTHVEQLQKDNKLVAAWDDETYDQSTKDDAPESYAKRYSQGLASATDKDEVVGVTDSKKHKKARKDDFKAKKKAELKKRKGK